MAERTTPRNPKNPSKTGWFLIGAFVALGIGAKIGVIWSYARMRKLARRR